MGTRDELLSFLREREGAWVSGASLSRRLFLSRSAVWKHACRLREVGYEIESSPRKGYLLKGLPDRVSPEEIRPNLRTKLFGQREIVYLPSAESTNTLAKGLAMNGSPEGTLVIAEEQTRGRGRRERVWYSPHRGGIYASLILRPHVSPVRAAALPLMASVALAETLLPLGPLEVSVKWPNDILVNGRKIAGMLVEMGAELDAVDFMVMGLGLNVNTRRFPAGLRTKATSLFLETGRFFGRAEVLGTFLRRFEEAYALFGRGEVHRVLERWRKLTNILGEDVTIDLMGGTLAGTVSDLDDTGALVLRDRRGELHRVLSGDVVGPSRGAVPRKRSAGRNRVR